MSIMSCQLFLASDEFLIHQDAKKLTVLLVDEVVCRSPNSLSDITLAT
jgi:hypothetical protein